MKDENYISIDIESDGPIPGPNSMLSLGAAAFSKDGRLLSTFSVNFELLPGATQDPNTMEWWSKNQAAYDETRKNIVSPCQGMKQFVDWVAQYSNPVCVAYPSGFDFLFVYWYLIKFLGKSPFSFSAVDVKTYAMAMLKTCYRGSSKKNMPKRWFPEDKHTHIAVDDAIEQGKLFCNMLKENV